MTGVHPAPGPSAFACLAGLRPFGNDVAPGPSSLHRGARGGLRAGPFVQAGLVPRLLVVGFLGLSACAGRRANWENDEVDGAGAQSSVSSTPLAVRVAEGDAAWERRGDEQALRTAIEVWQNAAVEAELSDPSLLVKLTRAHYFWADAYLREDQHEYLRVLDEGVQWGEKALLATSPAFAATVRDGGRFSEAVHLIEEGGIPAMYWYATVLGTWAKERGLAVMLGQQDNVKATMDRCLELDPEFFFGGPHRYFGVYYAVAPEFAGGDFEKAKVHFKRSLEIAPEYPATRVLWASELAVRTHDEALFDRLLAEALKTPGDAIPGLEPEIEVEKKKARQLAARKAQLF